MTLEELRETLLDAETAAEELHLDGIAFSVGLLADQVWDEIQEHNDDGDRTNA